MALAVTRSEGGAGIFGRLEAGAESPVPVVETAGVGTTDVFVGVAVATGFMSFVERLGVGFVFVGGASGDSANTGAGETTAVGLDSAGLAGASGADFIPAVEASISSVSGSDGAGSEDFLFGVGSSAITGSLVSEDFFEASLSSASSFGMANSSTDGSTASLFAVTEGGAGGTGLSATTGLSPSRSGSSSFLGGLFVWEAGGEGTATCSGTFTGMFGSDAGRLGFVGEAGLDESRTGGSATSLTRSPSGRAGIDSSPFGGASFSTGFFAGVVGNFDTDFPAGFSDAGFGSSFFSSAISGGAGGKRGGCALFGLGAFT
jgi:hypothetical protein